MTTYYTVDRRELMSAGKTINLIETNSIANPRIISQDLHKHCIELFQDGISKHGEQYLSTNPYRSLLLNDNSSPAIEMIWEYVRRANFPERPSRLTSFFAWKTLNEAIMFRNQEKDNEKKEKYRIYEIESDRNFCANMSLLNINSNLLGISYLANKYWSGEIGPKWNILKDPKWEVLISPPCKVVRKVET